MLQTKKYKCAYILLLGLLALLLFAAPGRAADYEGLDIVFVVDQSGSMSGIEGVAPSDVLGLRFYAPEYAMYWLGEDQLLVHPNMNYRIGMVHFGSRTETWNFGTDTDPIYWQSVGAASRDVWDPIYQTLREEMLVEMPTAYQRNLGYTDFLLALQRAEQLFAQLPEPAGERQRVIVLLTDGDPVREAQFVEDNNEKVRLMQEVESYVANTFPQPDYRMYVIGMNSGTNYWGLTGPYWERITNDPCPDAGPACPDPELDRAGLVDSNDDVAVRFHQILQDLTGQLPLPPGVQVVDERLLPGELAVPPYLESITFTYFKADPSERLVLTDPAGDVDLTRLGVTIQGNDGPIEVVRIASPQPGEWFVATDPPDTDVDITMRQIFAQSRLDGPRGVQGQYIPLTIEYALLDELGNPLPAYTDPRFRLIVEATLKAGRQLWPVMLTHQGNNNFTAEFTPLVTGLHTIHVDAQSQDLNGNPIVVFNGEIGSFSVSPASLVALDVPTQIQQYDQDTFSFELQDDRGFPITLAAPLTVTLNLAGPISETLLLEQQQDGTYQGAFAPKTAGNYNATVTATLDDPISGATHIVADTTLGQITVPPTTLVSLHLVEPQETEQNSTELWPFTPVPFVVEVELRDEAGQLVDPQAVFRDPDEAVVLHLVDGERNNLAGLLSLQPGGRPGVFRAETAELGRGEFDLEVRMGDGFQRGYLPGRQTSAARTINRIIHPLHLPIAGGALLTAILIGTIVAAVLAARRRVRIHPCTGRIVVIDAENVPLFQQNLDMFKRNHLQFDSKDIRNPMTHISKLVITSPNQQAYQNRQVQVEIYLDGNKSALSRLMGPGTEMKLGTYNIWLLKDPTEEQLLQERGSGEHTWSSSPSAGADWTGSSGSWFPDPAATRADDPWQASGGMDAPWGDHE